MGNAHSESFQKQFSSFLQRAEIQQIPKVEKLFSEITGSLDTSLLSDQCKEFYLQLIDIVAPSYTEEKRNILLCGWCSFEGEVPFSMIQGYIKKQFVTSFSFTATPLRQHCLSGVKTKMPVAIQIATPLPNMEREIPPLAVACVLDRSGSMHGNKLKFAIRSVLKVIKHLTSKDIFHLVTYDNHIQVPILNGNLEDKDSLKKIVNGIRTGGSTNIGDALRKASDLLAEISTTANPKIMKRILLFSDGHPNSGDIQDAPGLKQLANSIHQSGISISSFGLGRDYNEEIMKGIAEGGAGDYYFIASANEIPVTMSKAIHGLLDLFATNAKLLLRGKGDGMISQVFGKLASCDLASSIPIGDLYGNDRKKLLVELELAPKGSTCGNQLVCEATLSFERISETADPGQIETASTSVSIYFTDSEEVLQSSTQNNAVKIAEVMQKTASIDRQIVSLLDKREYNESIVLKQQSLDLLKDALPFDSEGNLPMVIQRVEAVLQKLKEKKDHASMRKMVDYEACLEENDCDFGYACLSDSDEDCYSDNDMDLDNGDFDADLYDSFSSDEYFD